MRYGPGDREEAYYRYIPFDVPTGTPGLTVHLAYDRSQATVDLGLFDPDGFRGWSGGERDHVSITPAASTPGYLPGAVQPGEWQIVLGLYSLPLEGVDVAATVILDGSPVPAPDAPDRPLRPERNFSPPAEEGRRWVAGDLHAHTLHSDGKLSVDQLATLAVSTGLDYLAVTDHNTISHHRELPAASRRYGITLLAGQEVTTPEGHANCFGEVGWVDFREGSDAWIEQGRRRGGILSVNHPVAPGCSWHRPLDQAPDLVELWHWTWDRLSPEPIAWWRSFGAHTPVGGSDFHNPEFHRLGSPTTWLEVPAGEDLEPGHLLQALRSGRVTVSADPATPPIVVHDGRVVVSDADSTVLISGDGRRLPVSGNSFSVRATPGLWVLVGGDGRCLSMCQVKTGE